MPRRRMLDPSFTDDTEVAQLTRDERLFLVGCLRNADDEGRLIGHPAYLKSEIFMYDEDINLERMQEMKESTLEKMKGWRPGNLWLLIPYQNSDREYLYFPNWYQFNKPSHPTPSKLPSPAELPQPRASGAPEQLTEALHPRASEAPEQLTEALQPKVGDSPETLTPSLSQSSLGQGRVSQVRGVQEDFTKFLGSERDLTDFLTKTLEKYLPRGPTWMVEVLQQLWTQALGARLKGTAFDLTLKAVEKYPVPVLARAYTKAVKYRGGRYDTAKYLDKILEEQMGKRKPP